MSLIDQIRMAQRDAGEAAVMADLKRKGLLIDEPKEPIMTDDATQQSQPNQIEAHMQAILNGQARDKAIAERDAALAECERLRADAERYRLIRRHPTFMGWDSDFRPDEIDAEVDKFKSIAARAKP